MTKKTSRTKKTNESAKAFKKRQDILKQIQAGRDDHDRRRKQKIPGFCIGVRAKHKTYGVGTVVRESMDYFHRVDLKLDKPFMLASSPCKTINVWPGDMKIIEVKSKKGKRCEKRKRNK